MRGSGFGGRGAVLASTIIVVLLAVPAGLAARTSPAVAAPPGATTALMPGHSAPAHRASVPISSLPRSWSPLSSAGAPSPRSHYAMAWDPAIGGLVIFGGCDGGAPWGVTGGVCTIDNDTWSYVDGVWQNLTTSVAPPASALPNMAYDPTEGGILMFGGQNGSANSQCLTETWLFTVGGWEQLFPSTVPGCGQMGMVFDGNLGHILMVSGAHGADESGPADVTYEFTGGNWVVLTTTTAFWRANPMMAWDSADHETVMFGGFDLSCGCQNLGDTWVFVNQNWTQIYPTSAPGARNEAAFADDPSEGGVLLFSGHYAYTYYDDTWLFHGGNWSQLTTSVAPSTRWAMNMVEDPALDQVVLFGGYNFTTNSPTFNNETWSWGIPSPITSVSALAQPSTLAVGQELLLQTTVAGGFGNLTYQYSGLPPGCPLLNASATILCVPTQAGHFLVTVNVSDEAGRWMETQVSFTVVTPTTVAPLVLAEVIAVPPTLQIGQTLTVLTVVAGGSGGNTYTYGGLPSGCASVDQPTLVCIPASAGSVVIAVTVEDAGGSFVYGNVSVDVLPVPQAVGPSLNDLIVAPDPATVGEPLSIVIVAVGGFGALTASYAGLPPGCASTNATVLECIPTAAVNTTITATVSDQHGLGASRNASLQVKAATAPPGGGSSSSSGGSSTTAEMWAEAALAIAAVAAVLAIVAVVRARPPSRPGPSG